MTTFDTEPLTPTFGARISGLDLSRPVEQDGAAALLAALLDHRVLVISGQTLTPEDHLRVSRIFGPLDRHVQQQYTIPGHPDIIKISNMFEGGQPIGLYDGDDEREWHTDYSWKQTMSSASLLLSVVATPGGGDTLFADTTTAYDDLPPGTRERIDGLSAVHSMTHLFAEQAELNPDKVPLTPEQAAQVPDVEHPLVRLHPVTGRRSLLLGDMIISGVVGLGSCESIGLLNGLHDHATQPRYVYRHQWSEGDLVIWDNRATMHSATPCDHLRYPRLLHRTTVTG